MNKMAQTYCFDTFLRDQLPKLEKSRREVMWLRRPEEQLHGYIYRHPQAKGVVIISHGFSESALKMSEAAGRFYEAGYSVYVFDHMGHGCSYRMVEDPSLIYVDSFQRYVRDLLYIAHKARHQNPHLPLYAYGHSMGGAIVLLAASQEPELFEKLVLSSPMIQPLTKPVPFHLAKTIVASACRHNRQKSYVAGHHPYEKEHFDHSACTSHSRFEWYRKIREADPNYQTCAASYQWLKSAIAANQALKKLKGPLPDLLLLQAQEDTFVSNEAQDELLEKLAATTRVAKEVFEQVKHEIYNSDVKTLARYWNRIFSFLANENKF